MLRIGIKIFLLLTLLNFFSCDDEPVNSLDKEIKQIDDYLAASGNTAPIVYDNTTGIRYVFEHFGENPPPHDGQQFRANITGRLFSDRSKIFTEGLVESKLDDITVFGLYYGLASIMTGSSVTLYVPSSHAFGPTGTADVPPNSTVIYEIELLEVTKTASEAEQFQIDTAAIHKYITDNSISNAIEHESGVWYTVEVQGQGPKPHVYNFVDFDYTLKLLPNANTVESNNLADQSIFGVIDGLKVGIPLLNSGSKATFYIPSGLAYGKAGSGSIKGNTNLIFEITLNEILR